jgi:pyruvate kinase
MVTMPTEAADDPRLLTEFVAKGMDVARVNCAHDDANTWTQMIANIRTSGRSAGGPRIAMDLAGPKLRTGPLKPGPRVVKISPTRDKMGRVTAPARVWLTANSDAAPDFLDVTGVTTLPVDDESWLQRRHAGERIEVCDSRDANRVWEIVEVTAQGCSAACEKTTYVTSGLKLTGRKDDAVGIGELPAIEQAHRVGRGDRVILTRSLDPAQPTPTGSTHRIGCTLPEAFDHARTGEQVWLDDGKIGGTIERVEEDEIELVVVDVRPAGANLRSGKGINLPDTELRLDALTAKDLEDLTFVAAHADVVNLSFVRSARDVERLQIELERLDASDIGIVLKIENVAAFENLPELLLAAMRSRKIGVMIARGDLAVEVGFERLAEVQEEIMWACEAAHVPVIWATQVLDTLARTGQPSRAEVTDAAMSDRAECVMLNKGPYITNAIGALDSILTRMQHHQDKKRSLLRQLHAWDRSDTDHSA